jgi:hypothetical protein
VTSKTRRVLALAALIGSGALNQGCLWWHHERHEERHERREDNWERQDDRGERRDDHWERHH